MPIELLIARWLGAFWVIVGLSHLLYPDKWIALLLPLRERETGGFILAAFGFPIGLVIVLGHNIWVWDVPVIVTVAGWLSTAKSAAYLLLPRAHTWVMSGRRVEKGMRIMGAVLLALGSVVGYEAFFTRN